MIAQKAQGEGHDGLHQGEEPEGQAKTTDGVEREPGDDSPRLQGGGFWNDAAVSSHSLKSFC